MIFVGVAVGGAIGMGFYFMRAKLWHAEKVTLEERLLHANEMLDRQKNDLDSLEARFKAISSDIVRQSREDFLNEAKPKIDENIRPLREALERYEKLAREIENRREEAYGGMKKTLSYLMDGQEKLTKETGSLNTALKSHSARGRWGEVTLRRVVEAAGMSPHCDFDEQSVLKTDGKDVQRPDLIVRLPRGRSVVVDAKVPLDAYMNAFESSDDDSRSRYMVEHAKSVREHMRRLGQKSYWSQFENAPDFTIMFLPGESLFSAALEIDRDLIEDGIRNGVIVSTPTSLIAILRSIELLWQQEKLAKNSVLIAESGKDLFDRLRVFAEHFAKMGVSLDRVVESFNSAVRSWESRLVPGARKLKDLGATKGTSVELPDVTQIEKRAGSLLEISDE